MTKLKEMQPVRPRPGLPLYESVKEAMIAAINRGDFVPAQKLPSTKELSQQFEVSLVTTHRALQELESTGLISRVQGRGTFVNANPNSHRRKRRIGVCLQQGLSLSDFYHSRLIEGINNAATTAGAEISIASLDHHGQQSFNGYMVINPSPEELTGIQQGAPGSRRKPTVVVGVREAEGVVCVDVDNANLMQRAVKHLAGLGHERIAYLGGAGDAMAYRVARREGFAAGMAEHGLRADNRLMVLTDGWCLAEADKVALMRCLSSEPRPTAIVAAGYYYALGVYDTVSTMGIEIPRQLSVVSVDDPPSAGHLNPPLTTLRQPVEELGHTAVHQLMRLIDGPLTPTTPVTTDNGSTSSAASKLAGLRGASPRAAQSHLLRGELIVRDSTTTPLRD